MAVLMFFLAAAPCRAQVNAEQVTAIGRNVLAMEDYMLAIHYFNLAIKAKDYLAEPYYLRAIAKMKLDDYRGAEADCSTAIGRSKFMTEAYKLRGFVRQQQGKDSLAIEDYDYGLLHNPTDREFLFYKAVAEINLKRFGSADSTLTRLIVSNPKFYEAVTARAQLRVESGDTVGALEDIEKSLQISKTQDYPYALRAQIYAEQEKWPEAIESLDDVIRLHPEQPDFYINRAYLKYKNDDYFGAMNDYNETLHLDPYNQSALFNRGLLRFEVMELAGAAEDFTKVLDLDANNFYARYNRALVYLSDRKYASAEADIRSIITRYPKFYPAYYALAQALQGRGDERGAIRNMMIADDIVRRYVQNPEKNPLDRPTIGSSTNRRSHGPASEETEEEMLERFNQLVTTEVDRQNALSFNDRYKGRVQDRETSLAPQPLFHLSFDAPEQSLKAMSNYFRELGELNNRNYISEKIYLKENEDRLTQPQIEETFEKAEKYTLALSGGKPRAIDHIARGIVYSMLRNYESALEDFNKALKLMPDYTVALMGKAYAMAMLLHTDKDMRPQAVIDVYDEVLRQNPMVVYAWFNKGNIYYENNDFDAAAACYDKAIEMNGELAEAWYNRGLARMQQGKRDEAFSDFSKAGELGVLQGYRMMKTFR